VNHLHALADQFAARKDAPGYYRNPVKHTTWINACPALVNQFELFIGGWVKNPAGFTTATWIYEHSKIVSTDPSKAPVGAYHHFLPKGVADGHIAKDIEGGGTVLLSATGRAIGYELAPYMRLHSVAQYVTGGTKYLGWSLDLAGGIPAYREPVIVVDPKPDELPATPAEPTSDPIPAEPPTAEKDSPMAQTTTVTIPVNPVLDEAAMNQIIAKVQAQIPTVQLDNTAYKPAIPDPVRLSAYFGAGLGIPAVSATFGLLALFGIMDPVQAMSAAAIIDTALGAWAGVCGVSNFTRTK